MAKKDIFFVLLNRSAEDATCFKVVKKYWKYSFSHFAFVAIENISTVRVGNLDRSGKQDAARKLMYIILYNYHLKLLKILVRPPAISQNTEWVTNVDGAKTMFEIFLPGHFLRDSFNILKGHIINVRAKQHE